MRPIVGSGGRRKPGRGEAGGETDAWCMNLVCLGGKLVQLYPQVTDSNARLRGDYGAVDSLLVVW